MQWLCEASTSLQYFKLIHSFAFSDSKQLFDAIVRGKRTAKRTLMIDISGAREAYKKFKIYSVGLVPGDQNPAEGLTKENNNGCLTRLLDSAMDNFEVTL